MLRFLLIDYDKVLIKDLTDILKLEYKNCDILTASNGEIGLGITIKYRPAMIFCGLQLPIMNGYDVLENIYQNNKLQSKTFILSHIDSVSNMMWLETQYSLDPDIHYLQRPFMVDEFLTRVYAILEIKS